MADVDALAQAGARPSADAMEIYRRVAFSALTSNVDNHLRNHGMLRDGGEGWSLASRMASAFEHGDLAYARTL